MIVKSFYNEDIKTDWYSLCKTKDKNYAMDFYKEHIRGIYYEQNSMKQVVFKILNTQKNHFLIYSSEYGVDFSDLFGESISYVKGEVKSRIVEALLKDNRIREVDSFEFKNYRRGILEVSFKVSTIYGEILEYLEVRY